MKKSGFRRALLFFGLGSFLEFFLVALAVFFASYFLTESELRQKALASFEQRLALFATEANVNFQKIRTIADSYATDERALSYTLTPSFSDRDIWTLAVMLRSLTHSAMGAAGVVDIDLYSTKSGVVLSTYYGYRKPGTSTNLALRETLYDAFLGSHDTYSVLFTPKGLYDHTGVAVTVLADIPLNSRLGVIAITYSVQPIPSTRLDGLDRVLLEDRSGNSMTMSASGVSGVVHAVAGGYAFGSDYQLAYQPVFDGRFDVVGEERSSVLFGAYRSVGDWFLGGFCLALLLCLAGAYFLLRGTNRVMSTYVAGLNAKVHKVLETKGLDATSTDTEVLSRAIDSIVARNRDYESYFRERKSMLLENTLRNLLLGVFENIPGFVRAGIGAGAAAQIVVAAMAADRPLDERGGDDRTLAVFESFARRFGGVCVRMDLRTTCLVLPLGDPGDRNEILAALERLRAELANQGKVSVTAGVSNAADLDGGIVAAYTEASDALRRRILLGGNRVVDAALTGDAPAGEAYFSLEEGKVLSQKLRSGSEVEVSEYLNKILWQNAERYTPEVFNAFLFFLCSSIAKVGAELRIRGAGLVDPHTLEALNTVDTVSDKERCLWVLCKRVLEARLREQHRYKKLSVEVVRDYIDRNFCSPLSLSIIASDLNISVSYLSSLLHREFGQNYASYINELRVERAMQIMLEEPRTTIKNIASRVGYDSEHTFIRNFKKRVGRSPSNWRNATVDDGSYSRHTE